MIHVYLLGNKWMFLSILAESNLYICLIFLIGVTSCSHTKCLHQTPIEIPCAWETPLQNGMTTENPNEFLWWEALNDPLLTTLIEQAACRNNDVLLAAESRSKEKVLAAMNSTAAEIAKNYIQLRGLQIRLRVVQDSIETQNKVFDLNKGLSNTGFISLIDYNENTNVLESLQMQKALIKFTITKLIYHISTLLSYPPGGLSAALSLPQELPEIPHDMPVGVPRELIQRHPQVQEIKQTSNIYRNKQAFYQYQKTVLNALEETENALADLQHQEEKFHYLDQIKKTKAESYQLTKDLYRQGLKDDHQELTVYQNLLSEENALIQGQVDLLISYVNLYQALVAGWEVVCRR